MQEQATSFSFYFLGNSTVGGTVSFEYHLFTSNTQCVEGRYFLIRLTKGERSPTTYNNWLEWVWFLLDENSITSAPLPVEPISKAYINDRSDGAKPSTILEHEVTTSLIPFCGESQQCWVLSKILPGTSDRAYVLGRSQFYIYVDIDTALLCLSSKEDSESSLSQQQMSLPQLDIRTIPKTIE